MLLHTGSASLAARRRKCEPSPRRLRGEQEDKDDYRQWTRSVNYIQIFFDSFVSVALTQRAPPYCEKYKLRISRSHPINDFALVRDNRTCGWSSSR
jgi:hypothetical protein